MCAAVEARQVRRPPRRRAAGGRCRQDFVRSTNESEERACRRAAAAAAAASGGTGSEGLAAPAVGDNRLIFDPPRVKEGYILSLYIWCLPALIYIL